MSDRIGTVCSLICTTGYVSFASLNGIPTHRFQAMYNRRIFLRFERYLEAGCPYIAHTHTHKTWVIVCLNLCNHDWGHWKTTTVINSAPGIRDPSADSSRSVDSRHLETCTAVKFPYPGFQNQVIYCFRSMAPIQIGRLVNVQGETARLDISDTHNRRVGVVSSERLCKYNRIHKRMSQGHYLRCIS